MGDSDATLLKKVKDNLWREWATATGQSDQEAIHEVETLLRAGRVAYKT